MIQYHPGESIDIQRGEEFQKAASNLLILTKQTFGIYERELSENHGNYSDTPEGRNGSGIIFKSLASVTTHFGAHPNM